MDKKSEKESEKKKGTCETCEFFEDDEVYGPTCALALDEDEFADFIAKETRECPYYRRYDEYETVRRQN